MRHVTLLSPPPLPPDAPQPLVTVIIPTRNRAHLLTRSVNSVLAQTYRNFELIVVDDASSDGTGAVLAAIADPRLRVLRREQNKSAAAARNAALPLMRGELVAFHDDDDVWLPEKLERQVAALAASPATTALCLCGRLFVQSPGPYVRYIGGQHLADQLDFSQGNGQGGNDYALIATPGWLVRRAALEATGGFDERIRSWDDWELGLRLWLEHDFVVVDQPLYIQDHVAGGGLMKLERARADDIVIIDEKHGALWANNPRVRARHAYIRGIARLMFDPPPAGRAEIRESLRLYPFSLKAWVALALSYLNPTLAIALAQRIRGVKQKLWMALHRQ
jgi:glycosyltransferase involved in cell wall biosynthesis